MRTEETNFRLSLFLKSGGPLSKTIELDDNAQPVSDASDCQMAAGTAQNMSVVSLSGLADLINEMSSAHALALGTILDRKNGKPVQITTKNRLSGADDQIARTKDFFIFAKGEPGLLLIDFDQKGMPDNVRALIEEAGSVWELICDVLPDLRSAGYLRRASTSAGLRNVETGEEFEGSGGEHIYIAIQDASDIPRATKVLHQRLWLAGSGWIRLGKIGQLLERSIVDQSVGSPERLVFEGAPVLSCPLEQSEEARRPLVYEGELIDTTVAIPDMSAQEMARLSTMLQKRRTELKPKADKRREKEDERLSVKLVGETGVSINEARKQIERRHSGELLPLHPLIFDDPELGEVSVGDVLRDPARFVEQTLADPLEGLSYGRNKAMVFRRSDGSLWINSFAHGGAQYDLKHNGASLRATPASKASMLDD